MDIDVNVSLNVQGRVPETNAVAQLAFEGSGTPHARVTHCAKFAPTCVPTTMCEPRGRARARAPGTPLTQSRRPGSFVVRFIEYDTYFLNVTLVADE